MLVVDALPIKSEHVSHVEILPGEHVIEWEFIYPNRYAEVKRLRFQADADHTYRLGQRFFPAPYQGNPIEMVLDFAIEVTVTPLALIFPPEAAPEPPEGEYFMWIVDQRSRLVAAGMPPDLPQAPSAITFVPVEEH